MDRTDQLAPLTAFINTLLFSQQPAQRKRVLQKIAKALLKFNRDRIAAQTNPDGSAYEARKKGNAKLLLSLRKQMKTVVTADRAEVGFSGWYANIARVHQEGLKIPVTQGGPEYRYPIRMLLGISDDDIEAIKTIILEAVA